RCCVTGGCAPRSGPVPWRRCFARRFLLAAALSRCNKRAVSARLARRPCTPSGASRFAFAYHPLVIPFAPLTTAQPDFNDQGELRSTLYDDIYASADGALAQAAHVFVAGN